MDTPDSSRTYNIIKNEGGFVLVMSMVALVTLTLLGVWAMSGSSIELLISGNHQRYEENFQIAEGAVVAQGGDLGFNRRAWYEISDPNAKGVPLVPNTEADFDPGGDKNGNATPMLDFNAASVNNQKVNHTLWPTQNLLGNIVNNQYDYTYLTTYLYDTTPPKGTGEDFAAYKFRVNSNKTLALELGGLKLGPRVVSFED